MGNSTQVCSICSLPPDALAAINSKLRARVKFRDLARESGISKSTLQRHAAKCIEREILNQHKQTAAFDPLYRFHVQWPGETLETPLGETGVTFVVEYAPLCIASYGDLRSAPYSQENFSQWVTLARAEDGERAALEKELLLPAEPSADVNPA
jgi:hypothetical protein